jgi:hypothetical protein
VDNFEDGLRECRPSAESAEEFYELTIKSPLRLIAINFNGLCINAATFRSPALQPVGPAVVSARGRAGEVHIFCGAPRQPIVPQGVVWAGR